MIQSTQLNVLENSLDAAMLRQKVINNNISNIDTPHFQSKHVVFESLLKEALEGNSGRTLEAYRTNQRHIPFGTGLGNIPQAQIITNNQTSIQNNGNNVDIESEMSQQAKNTIWYNGLVQLTNGYFTKLKSVVEGGR
ncbi:flagellar biosynthesis protein FlgB [Brevibacillus sp. SKDU10]|uniref:flagellar basal body rod protein FlgB n=1 Tax=Brevibacillus sp. SKDU10 TaxID=1247872 RepID=UPI0007C8BCBF|nr:flagellar basal body rod protein FlgB [Brevibacillus sp. SKDU10]OAJ75417.1 flagellar biosynthesis protein FlgB [Brevibacillus sp. SKDU10]